MKFFCCNFQVAKSHMTHMPLFSKVGINQENTMITDDSDDDMTHDCVVQGTQYAYKTVIRHNLHDGALSVLVDSGASKFCLRSRVNVVAAYDKTNTIVFDTSSLNGTYLKMCFLQPQYNLIVEWLENLVSRKADKEKDKVRLSWFSFL